MVKRFVRKKKTLVLVSSLMLIGTAFQPGGCTVNLDGAALGELANLLEGFSGSGDGPQGPGPGDWQEGGDWHEGGEWEEPWDEGGHEEGGPGDGGPEVQ